MMGEQVGPLPTGIMEEPEGETSRSFALCGVSLRVG